MASQPTLTILPPGPQTREEHFPAKRIHAVEAKYTPTGWDSTRLSFSDYGRMHIAARGRSSNTVHCRTGVPEWALDDEQTREVITRYLEYRNYLAPALDKTYEERLARVNEASARQFPAGMQLLKSRLDRRVSDVEIMNADTKLVLEQRGFPALVSAVVYMSYRLNYDSVEVCKETGVKPPHVRILLYRLNKVAKDIEQGFVHKQGQRNGAIFYDYSDDMIDAVVCARRHGDTWKQIAEALGDGFKAYLVRAAYTQYLPKEVLRPKRKWTPERLAEVAKLRKKGWTYRRIAAKLGITGAALMTGWRNYRIKCNSK